MNLMSPHTLQLRNKLTLRITPEIRHRSERPEEKPRFQRSEDTLTTTEC